MATQGHTDDFDIGKAIFDQLKDLPPDRQQRVLRWVSEGLGVPTVPTPTTPAPPPQAPGYTPELAVRPGGSSDIKSFIAAKAPRSDNQFAAAVAYYYRFEAPPAERRNTVGPSQLQEAARLAGRKRLANPRVTLNNAKAMGYLDSATPGEFVINSVGENLVAMTLPGGAETTPATKRRGAKKKHRAKGKR